jgi:hypothetical protein
MVARLKPNIRRLAEIEHTRKICVHSRPEKGEIQMAKPSLKEPFRTLENEIIDTLIAGHKEWRPDLSYPESYSDMQAAVRGLLRMFDVKRRPIALDIKELLPKEGDANA